MTPVLYPPVDGSDAAHLRLSGDDPLVMYLVAPRRASGSVGELLVDAGAATLRCEDRFARDARWSEAFAAWESSSFRKVCLRARPSEMDRAAQLDCACVGEVLCFPPRRRSVAEPELSRLQAHIGPPLAAGPDPLGVLDRAVMLLLICEELEMTAGKACAQVGHAVLLAQMLHPRSVMADWRAAGTRLAVGMVGGEAFSRVREELTVVGVRDAGLTQVRPGTETVLACAPGEELPAWLGDAARPVL